MSFLPHFADAAPSRSAVAFRYLVARVEGELVHESGVVWIDTDPGPEVKDLKSPWGYDAVRWLAYVEKQTLLAAALLVTTEVALLELWHRRDPVQALLPDHEYARLALPVSANPFTNPLVCVHGSYHRRIRPFDERGGWEMVKTLPRGGRRGRG